MKWKCVCGYIHDGEAPPTQCPKCGAPAEKFVVVEEKIADLIDRSRYTNQLLAALMNMGEELESIGEAGIEDNLDPGCIDVFTYAKKAGIELRQMSKAEIQTHVQKSKWG